MIFEPEINALIQRFENTISQGSVQYYDTDDLETIIDCYIAIDQLDKARIALDYAYRIHPDSTEIRCKEGKLCLMEGAYEKAIEILDPIQHTEPDYIAILAECHLRMYNFNKSKKLFSQYLTLCNTNELAAVFADIASLYNSHNQPELALEFIENGVALFPDDTNILIEKAFALEQLDQLDQAASLFSRVLDINPYQPEIWGMLGSILFRQNNFTEAIKAYDYTLAINPDDISAKLQRAHCLFNLGQFKEAIEPYEDYLKINPYDEMVITFLAETYENIDEWETAQKLYQNALNINNNIIEAWVGLAASLHTLGKLEEAYKTIKKADKRFPKNPTVIYSMWQIEEDLATENFDDQMMKKALNHALFCLNLDTKNSFLHYTVGNMYLHFSNFKKALTHYEIAYNQNPFTEKLPLAMAISYYAVDKIDKAQQFLDIARQTISNSDEIFFSLFPDAKIFIR